MANQLPLSRLSPTCVLKLLIVATGWLVMHLPIREVKLSVLRGVRCQQEA